MVFFTLTSTAQAWWNDDWSMRKKIILDASPTGGAITDPIGTTPVLIRLHDGDFQFASAKDDGSDLRFIADDDKTPLSYHIEKYDSLLGEAFVWVKVPNLKPSAQTTLWLYYGGNMSKPAAGGPDAKATYDSDAVLVYHFAEHDQPPQDATASGNNAQNAGTGVDSSLIGPGLRFDGKGSVTIPGASSLAWIDGGAMTWSAWIKLGTLQSNAVIFSRRDGGKDFLIGADNGVLFVDANGIRSQGGTALAAGTWHHVAVTANGGKITLYLDGDSYATLSASLPALNGPSQIGGDAADVPVGTTTALNGELDELEISKIARPVGFIKLAAIGQSGDKAAKLLAVGQDEQPPAGWLSGSFGLFGVILKSVTVDGWVVIGVLAIMGIISWYVMVTKFFHLNVVQKSNSDFLKEWRHVATDLTVLDHGEGEAAKSMGGRLKRGMHNASLYRIYHVGVEEIGHRMAIPNGPRILSSQSIQAIRASLDGSFVRENHSLNAGMVFLTISIAGGPFMGLLGTCIGVMITFAAIAATGEVNISAIAPGLAAALVATVAGLLVAIPALLGYNYLTSRMKTVSSDMQIFVDEFVTKMAEFYRPNID